MFWVCGVGQIYFLIRMGPKSFRIISRMQITAWLNNLISLILKYIGDVLTINNLEFVKYIHIIYLSGLDIGDITDICISASNLTQI